MCRGWRCGAEQLGRVRGRRACSGSCGHRSAGIGSAGLAAQPGYQRAGGQLRADRDFPGLGVNPRLGTDGDAFYFPIPSDAERSAAQGDLAALLLSPDVQVAFNLRKGSLPVRCDMNLEAANDCMRQGLQLLANGTLLPDTNQLLTPDTMTQLEDLFQEFSADTNILPEAAQARLVDIIADAEKSTPRRPTSSRTSTPIVANF